MESKEEEKSDASNGIQVYLRIRPSSNPSDFIQRDDIDVNKISFHIPKSEDVIVNNSKSSYDFKFNGVLDDRSKQRDVFKTIGIPVIKNALAGYNSTIFAVRKSCVQPFLPFNLIIACLVRANRIRKNIHHHWRARQIRR